MVWAADGIDAACLPPYLGGTCEVSEVEFTFDRREGGALALPRDLLPYACVKRPDRTGVGGPYEEGSAKEDKA